MPTYSVNKVAAFALRTADLLTRKQPELLAKGYTVTADVTFLNDEAAALPVTDQGQEHAKTDQVEATSAVQAATVAAYRKASAGLTTAAGFLGKTGPEADEARRIRNECANDRNPVQVAAFITSVIAYLNAHTAALIAKNYNPAAKITELTPLSGSLTTGKGQQEDMKGDRGEATNAVLAEIDTLYTRSNDILESVIGLYDADPDHETVKEVRRIRAELRGNEPPPEPPAPPTPPGP